MWHWLQEITSGITQSRWNKKSWSHSVRENATKCIPQEVVKIHFDTFFVAHVLWQPVASLGGLTDVTLWTSSGSNPYIRNLIQEVRENDLPSLGVKEGLSWVFSCATMARKSTQPSPSFTPRLGISISKRIWRSSTIFSKLLSVSTVSSKILGLLIEIQK